MTRMMVALAVMVMTSVGCGDGETQPASSASAASSPSPAEAQRIEMSAVDFAFEGAPETVEAGEATFALMNEGEVSHEMTIGLLPDGWTIEEVALGSGESGTKIVGVVHPIAPGASGEVTMDLEPGRYGYICH